MMQRQTAQSGRYSLGWESLTFLRVMVINMYKLCRFQKMKMPKTTQLRVMSAIEMQKGQSLCIGEWKSYDNSREECGYCKGPPLRRPQRWQDYDRSQWNCCYRWLCNDRHCLMERVIQVNWINEDSCQFWTPGLQCMRWSCIARLRLTANFEKWQRIDKFLLGLIVEWTEAPAVVICGIWCGFTVLDVDCIWSYLGHDHMYRSAEGSNNVRIRYSLLSQRTCLLISYAESSLVLLALHILLPTMISIIWQKPRHIPDQLWEHGDVHVGTYNDQGCRGLG